MSARTAPVPRPRSRTDTRAIASDPQALSGLIGSFYQGVMDPMPWQHPLQQLREFLGALHVTLILRPPSPHSPGVIINTDTVSELATHSYETHFFAIDPFVHLPRGQIVTPEELVGARRWRESPLYREYLRPLDVGHLVGADLRTDDGIDCRFRVARRQDAPAFSDAEKALCHVLLPHLQRAIQLHARMDTLECERQLFAGTVNRLQMGMITYARNGQVLDVNDEARRILGEEDGIALASGTLRISSNAENREIQRLLREALQAPSLDARPSLVEAMSVSRPSGRGRYSLVVRAIPPTGAGQGLLRPAAAVFLRDPESSRLPAARDMVCRLFGLTPMEAELAVCLAEGLDVDEAAARMGVTRNTVRTYLRFIFSKTGVTRQAMLVRLLLNSVASLSGERDSGVH